MGQAILPKEASGDGHEDRGLHIFRWVEVLTKCLHREFLRWLLVFVYVIPVTVTVVW